jgi:hypothetical protein
VRGSCNTSERGARRRLLLAEGTAGTVAGSVALLWPEMIASGLLYLIMTWALETGIHWGQTVKAASRCCTVAAQNPRRENRKL